MLAGHGIATRNIFDMLDRYGAEWPVLDTCIEFAAPPLRTHATVIHLSFDLERIVVGGRWPPSLARRLTEAAAVDQHAFDTRIRRGRGHPAPLLVPASVTERAAAVGAAAVPLAEAYFAS